VEVVHLLRCAGRCSNKGTQRESVWSRSTPQSVQR